MFRPFPHKKFSVLGNFFVLNFQKVVRFGKLYSAAKLQNYPITIIILNLKIYKKMNFIGGVEEKYYLCTQI